MNKIQKTISEIRRNLIKSVIATTNLVALIVIRIRNESWMMLFTFYFCINTIGKGMKLPLLPLDLSRSEGRLCASVLVKQLHLNKDPMVERLGKIGGVWFS